MTLIERLELIEEEEKITHQTDFWDDPKAAEVVLKSIKRKKIWTNSYSEVEKSIDDLAVLYEFFQEDEADEKEVDEQYVLKL